MNVTDIILVFIIALVFGCGLGLMWGYTSVKSECDNFSQTYLAGDVYVCTLKDPEDK